MCKCEKGGCVKSSTNKSCSCIKDGKLCSDKCGCSNKGCLNKLTIEQKEISKPKVKKEEVALPEEPKVIKTEIKVKEELEVKKIEKEQGFGISINHPSKRCRCYKSGCRNEKTMDKCKCITCNEHCGCGEECKKTQNLIKKGTKPKKHFEGENLKLDIKKEDKKEKDLYSDKLYIFLDTEGGKTNDLHDLYATLKFGEKGEDIVYYGLEYDIHLKENFEKFNEYLDNLAEKFHSKLVYLCAWCMDSHDKIILKKFVKTNIQIQYLDLKKMYQKISESDNYELQSLNSLLKLKIKGTAHTAKYDTLVMVACFCIAIAEYFSDFVLPDEFECLKDNLIYSYNENDKDLMIHEENTFSLLGSPIPFNNGEMKLRNGKVIEKEVMMTLLEYMKSSMYK